MKSIVPCLIALTFALPALPVRAHDAAFQMAEFANAFLGSLKPEQKEKATFKFEEEERENWHFIPRERKGLPIKEMTDQQRLLAHARGILQQVQRDPQRRRRPEVAAAFLRAARRLTEADDEAGREVLVKLLDQPLDPPQRQTVGDYVGLCILVDFSDMPARISDDEVEAFCNKPGYNGFGNAGSVFDYFKDCSSGKLRFRTNVTPYYRARRPRARAS